MLNRSRILALIIIISLLGLSGCAYRPPVQQGTILTNADVKRIHRGMTKSDVLNQLGKPVLINLFSDNRLVYVYTMKPSRKAMQERQLQIYFRSGRVVNYKVFSSPNLKTPL